MKIIRLLIWLSCCYGYSIFTLVHYLFATSFFFASSFSLPAACSSLSPESVPVCLRLYCWTLERSLETDVQWQSSKGEPNYSVATKWTEVLLQSIKSIEGPQNSKTASIMSLKYTIYKANFTGYMFHLDVLKIISGLKPDWDFPARSYCRSLCSASSASAAGSGLHLCIFIYFLGIKSWSSVWEPLLFE